ncbi:MAG: formate--tetrahydrofolate ligase, partial [Rhodobacteraceae bacterium]|nr:formate--tetrahydrofolate ligase [Paracoccaceae bacterium]
ANLARHIANVRGFGVPVVVAVNHFNGDTAAEHAALAEVAAAEGVEAVICRHWAEGGAGIEALARRVVALAEGGGAGFQPLYPDAMPLWDKIGTIATRIYRAGSVSAAPGVREQLSAWEVAGHGDLPVCMAKTQYSFSTDPSLRGAPEGFDVHVREVRLSAGAGFVVAVCGDIMTMPGLPRVPAAETIRLGEGGRVEGLF